MIIRRNTEGTHQFSDIIDTSLGIFDMQGLLLNSQGSFTAAIEAFELPKHETFTNLRQETFGNEEALYVRACFAAQVGVPFYVILHIEGTKRIKLFQVYADINTHHCECQKQFWLSEPDFIEWWHERKQPPQTKPYREQFLGRVSKSYFDSLLEANGLKWGGNIDGYFVSSPDSNYQIEGIIEKRFTTKKTIYDYDPAFYFKYGGGDYNTWKPLFTLKSQLDVPLYLFTYSRCTGEQHKVGATIVTELSQKGINYILDENRNEVTPNSKICNDEAELRQRLQYLQSL